MTTWFTGVATAIVMFYTAKANGLFLYEYLVRCMKELAKPELDIDSLLPWN